MISIRALLPAIALVASVGQVQAAPTHIFDYTYDGSTLTTNASAAGAQLLNGDTVHFDLHAAGTGYWNFLGGSLWAPVAMVEAGNRVGDLVLTLWLDGAVVASSSYIGQTSQFVHIANNVSIAGPLKFDELEWDFTQTSYAAQVPGVNSNTLGTIYSAANIFLSSPRPTYVVGTVPEPSTIALLGMACLAAGALRRRAA